jgi:hypothetical protein
MVSAGHSKNQSKSGKRKRKEYGILSAQEFYAPASNPWRRKP